MPEYMQQLYVVSTRLRFLMFYWSINRSPWNLDFKAAKQAGITCTKSTQTLLPIAVGSSQEVVCAQRV